MRWLCLLTLFAMTGCRRPVPVVERSEGPIDLLVIAPHPDDEVLMAGGRMSAALAAHQHVAVILVTNGDFTCERDGYQREAESVAVLQHLGLEQRDIHFLGYPDGALAKLTQIPLPPLEHRDANGECVARTGTWADRRAGRVDEHSNRTGTPAEWTDENLVGDLAALLKRLEPREVVVPHGIDEHPDHAMTYVFFRRALDRLERAPTLAHRSVVHFGRCWPAPTCDAPFSPTSAMPTLPPPLGAYMADERLATDPQAKLNLIARYVSQAGPDAKTNWLSAFARIDEATFSEQYVREGKVWVAAGSSGTHARRTRAVGGSTEIETRDEAGLFHGVAVER